MPNAARFVINILGFNAGWFACVLAARWGVPLAAAPIIAIVLAVHLLVNTPRAERRAESLVLLGVALAGTLVDTANLLAGAIRFDLGIAVFIPWIALFWLNFSATLNTALRWLAPMPRLAALLGVIAAPGTYLAGSKLGALDLHDNTPIPLAAIAVQWAIILPAALYFAHRTRFGRSPWIRRIRDASSASGTRHEPSADAASART